MRRLLISARAARRLTLANLRADVAAGLVAAIVAVPQSVPLGVIAFAPLGGDWLWLGVLSGLYSSIFAGFTAALLGGAPLMVSGPRASSSLVVAGMVASLMADPEVASRGGAMVAASLAFLAIFLAGAIQAGFGLFRLGRLIKYIPYPVIAGFMNGVAILILLGQVRAILGLPLDFRWTWEWEPLAKAAHPGAVLICLVALVAIRMAPRLTRRVPPPLAGLIAGVAAYHLLGLFTGTEALGMVVGRIPDAAPGLDTLLDVLALPVDTWLFGKLAEMLPSIAVLALVGAVDSLLSAVGLDVMTGMRHDSDRELVAQGLSNMVGACFGGVASTGSLARSTAALKAGAKSRLTGMIHALILLAIVEAAAGALAYTPLAAMAGIMVVVAVAAFDSWSRQLMWQLPRSADHRREIVANLTVVVSVAAATVLVNLVAAVGLGMALSMGLFVRKMSKPIVRRRFDGRMRRSLKVRSREEAELLFDKGYQLALFELDGPLFFGTADALLTEVQKRSGGVKVVILDFRRVGEMDSTGVRILGQLGQELQKKGRALVLANLTADDPLGRFLLEMGGAALADMVRLFPDADTALEWAEDSILELHGAAVTGFRELALPDLPLVENLAPDDLAVLAGVLERREYPQGAELFHEGDPGDVMYILARGSVTIRLARQGAPPMRLATLQPGVMFGEMALLEWQPRSADAVAEDDVVVYALPAESFIQLAGDHPQLSQQLMLNIARELAARLRVTSAQLRAAV